MTQVSNPEEIILPDYALSAKIQELNTDIRHSTVGTGLTLAVGGAGVLGAYALLTGIQRPPIVEVVAPGSGALAVGRWSGGLALQVLELRSKRRSLKKEERQGKVMAAKHYEQHPDLYEEQAFREAMAAGVKIQGWEELNHEKRTTRHGKAIDGSEPALGSISEGRKRGPLPSADEQI